MLVKDASVVWHAQISITPEWCIINQIIWWFLHVINERSPRYTEPPGSCFNIKMTSYQYRKSHCGDKTVLRSSYLHNGISYSGKMTSLYWVSPLVPDTFIVWFVDFRCLCVSQLGTWYNIIYMNDLVFIHYWPLSIMLVFITSLV